MKLADLEQQAELALRACLQEVPFVEVESLEKVPEADGKSPSFWATLKLSTGSFPLAIATENSGQPRIAKGAVNKLFRTLAANRKAYGIFIAPYISPASAAICAADGIGYIDLAGNCRLCFDRVYIQKEGKPNPFSEKRDLRSLYSPKAERILRVLLTLPQKAWKLQDLASEAAVSLGQASNIKKLLSEREWIDSSPEGLKLSAPDQLLKEWSANYNYRRHQVFDFYSLKSVGEIEVALAEACQKEGIRYALTGFSGAARIAPSVRYQRVMAYVDSNIEQLARKLNLKAADSGANVSLLAPYDQGVFYKMQDIDGSKVVSPIQLYLDLFGFRGRGEEAAAALLEQVIQPQW